MMRRSRADTIIAATGSRPQIPEIPGIDLPEVYTPHTLFTYKEDPGETLNHRRWCNGC